MSKKCLSAKVYSHGGRRTAHRSEQGEGLPRRYKSTSSSHSGYGLPVASRGSSRLAESGSSKSHSRHAAAGSQSDAYGRHVDGNSRQGSVSSYRPTSPWSSKPRQTPQQPQRGTHKSQLATWAHPSPQNGEKNGPRVVSSGAIEMLAEAKPTKKQPVVKAGAWGDTLVSPDVKRANAPRRPVTSTDYSRRQQSHSRAPGVLQNQGGKWDTASPQGEGKFRSVSALDRATAKPLKKQLSSPSSVSFSQSRGDKRGSVSGSKIKPKNLHRQTGPLPRGPRPMIASSFRVEPPSSETVLQSKEDMWKSVNLPVNADLRPASVYSRRVPSLYSTPKPSLREYSSSAFGKTDVKAATWGGAYDSNPLMARPRSYPGPVASLYPHEGKRPQVVSVSGSSRWPSAH